MSAGELATLGIVILASVMVFRQARDRSEWSWRAFAWTLLLVLVYAAVTVSIGIGTVLLVGNDRLLLALLGFLVPIAVGIVPVMKLAKRIKQHYVKPGQHR